MIFLSKILKKTKSFATNFEIADFFFDSFQCLNFIEFRTMSIADLVIESFESKLLNLTENKENDINEIATVIVSNLATECKYRMINSNMQKL